MSINLQPLMVLPGQTAGKSKVDVTNRLNNRRVYFCFKTRFKKIIPKMNDYNSFAHIYLFTTRWRNKTQLESAHRLD